MLTFDDGPVPETTAVVDALSQFMVDGEKVRAGFFMVGDNDPDYHSFFEVWHSKGSVWDYPGIDIARIVAQNGHLIGNHTQHHAYFPKWSDFNYDSMSEFVVDEITWCEYGIFGALNNAPLKIFRPPYVYDNQQVKDGAAETGHKIIWGQLVGDASSFSVSAVKDTALKILDSWDQAEPCVLIFHDIRPQTYNHIAEIVSYLQDNGYVLAHFDPNRISAQATRQTLIGAVECPVDIIITDPDGLILNKQSSQIPFGLYKEEDVNEDGEMDDFFAIPEAKIGEYLIQVIPEPGASLDDIYSLDLCIGEQTVKLANMVPICEIPTKPYQVQITESGIQDVFPPTVLSAIMPPVPSGDNGWYSSDTTVTLSANEEAVIFYKWDNEDATQTAQNSVEISVPVGICSLTYYAVDLAGNIGLEEVQTIKLDNSAPLIAINLPEDEATYTFKQLILANWSAIDLLSGIDTSTGTLPSGDPIDTLTVGAHNFMVEATDKAGNTATKTVTYYVRYNYGGILQPINRENNSVFKLGSTIPVKFQLKDANGNYVTDAQPHITAVKDTSSVTGTVLETATTLTATAGDAFRYDTSSNQYIYNLSTKGLSTGTWKIQIELGDGTSKYVTVSLK